MHGCRIALAMAVAVIGAPALAKRPPPPAFAEPGDIVAAESRFGHIAAAKGVKAAIRATAGADAEVFAPPLQRVAAFAAPDVLPPWHTRQVWMSCDGSAAVTYGQWERGSVIGWYGAVWQRQKGGYAWVLAQGGTLGAPLPETDMIGAKVADCPERRARVAASPVPERSKAPADHTAGHADDHTLEWATAVAGDGSRVFTVSLKQDGALHEVLRASARPGG